MMVAVSDCSVETLSLENIDVLQRELGARSGRGGVQGGLGSALQVHVLSDKEHLLCRFPNHKGGSMVAY